MQDAHKTSGLRTHTDGRGHRKFIILRLDTQQAPSSRNWPGMCPHEVVLGAEEEIRIIMQRIFPAGGLGPKGLGCCIREPPPSF